jgi:hypothetical protein
MSYAGWRKAIQAIFADGATHETSAEPTDITEATCYNGNHGARDGVCVVDGGHKSDDLRALLATGDVRGRK